MGAVETAADKAKGTEASGYMTAEEIKPIREFISSNETANSKFILVDNHQENVSFTYLVTL
jgi:hypothetical protein